MGFLLCEATTSSSVTSNGEQEGDLIPAQLIKSALN